MIQVDEKIKKALRKSREHWRYNFETFPYYANDYDKLQWFRKNCQYDTCELCKVISQCSNCPLRRLTRDKDKNDICCYEWRLARNALQRSSLRKHHIKRVLDRLKLECKRVGI